MVNENNNEVESIQVICHRCKYKWIFTGKNLKYLGKYPVYAQCPVCHTSVRIEKLEDNKNDN